MELPFFESKESVVSGIVLEAFSTRSRGLVATSVLRKGTLHVGDVILAGTAFGRVRRMTDVTTGRPITAAIPSAVVEVRYDFFSQYMCNICG
jgi:translation initiation factor IF-2